MSHTSLSSSPCTPLGATNLAQRTWHNEFFDYPTLLWQESDEEAEGYLPPDPELLSKWARVFEGALALEEARELEARGGIPWLEAPKSFLAAFGIVIKDDETHRKCPVSRVFVVFELQADAQKCLVDMHER